MFKTGEYKLDLDKDNKYRLNFDIENESLKITATELFKDPGCFCPYTYVKSFTIFELQDIDRVFYAPESIEEAALQLTKGFQHHNKVHLSYKKDKTILCLAFDVVFLYEPKTIVLELEQKMTAEPKTKIKELFRLTKNLRAKYKKLIKRD